MPNQFKNLFILGNPRSGTSLLRIILNNHKNIVAPPECGFAHWWLEKYKDWSWPLYQDKIAEFIADLATSKKMETWNLDFEILKRQIIEFQPSTYEDLVNLVYLAYADDFNQISVIADKNNYYIHHLQDLNKIWKNAYYIHIVRDGRDVACSYLNLNKISDDLKYKPKLTNVISEVAKEWVANNEAINNFGLKKHDKYILIRYEDLIMNTEFLIKQVCELLQVDFDEQTMEYYKNSDEKKGEPLATLHWKNIVSF